MLTNKELASEVGCTVPTLISRVKRVKMRPTFGGYSWHRWNRADADKFIHKWSQYTQKLKSYVAKKSSVGKVAAKPLSDHPQANGRRRHVPTNL